MSDDGDTIDFTDDFAAAIVNYAAYLAWNGYRQEANQAAIELSAYERQMDKLRQTYIIFSEENLKFRTQISDPFFNGVTSARNEFPNNARV